jgi:hypothetical protein
MGTVEDVHVDDRRSRDRRQTRRGFVWREQRTGFDRRCRQGGGAGVVVEHTLMVLRDRPRLLRWLLVVVNILNVADFGLTLNALDNGVGEANPIMRALFSLGPAWAGVFKITSVFLTTLLVWRCRGYRLALAAALIMVGLFAVVAVYHFFGLATIS